MADARIRPTRREDLPLLQEIERSSGQRFREYGLDQVADDEPASIETLAAYADAGRSWVAVGKDEALGYVLVDEIDGAALIEQISVALEFQGRGLGRALLDQVRLWAAAQEMTAITLTTFGHFPWNRSLYEHLGFRVPPEDEIGSGLREVREAEAEHGLDPKIRVVMCLELLP